MNNFNLIFTIWGLRPEHCDLEVSLRLEIFGLGITLKNDEIFRITRRGSDQTEF